MGLASMLSVPIGSPENEGDVREVKPCDSARKGNRCHSHTVFRLAINGENEIPQEKKLDGDIRPAEACTPCIKARQITL